MEHRGDNKVVSFCFHNLRFIYKYIYENVNNSDYLYLFTMLIISRYKTFHSPNWLNYQNKINFTAFRNFLYDKSFLSLQEIVIAMNTEQIEIVTKVKELYYRYGLKSVTMDDAARELGISKKTLYQFFSDKEKLIEAVIKLQIDIHTQKVDLLLSNAEDAVSEMFMIHQFLDHMTKEHSFSFEYDLKKYYPNLYTHVLNIKRDRIYKIGINNIEKGIASGHYRKEVNAKVISKINLMRYESTIGECMFSPDEISSKGFFNQILNYHVRGMATSKGIERLEELMKQFDSNN